MTNLMKLTWDTSWGKVSFFPQSRSLAKTDLCVYLGNRDRFELHQHWTVRYLNDWGPGPVEVKMKWDFWSPLFPSLGSALGLEEDFPAEKIEDTLSHFGMDVLSATLVRDSIEDKFSYVTDAILKPYFDLMEAGGKWQKIYRSTHRALIHFTTPSLFVDLGASAFAQPR